jgi:hypothetical protein
MSYSSTEWTPRAEWSDLPQNVRSAINDLLGSPVKIAINQQGGFSPGLAAVVRCADGTEAFVKAVGPELNEHTPDLHRQEASKAARLPSTIAAPTMRGSYDDGAWVALAFDVVKGRTPTMPWTSAQLTTVVDAIERLGVAGTPNPIRDLPALSTTHGDDLVAWTRLAANPPPDLTAWETMHLDRLASISQEAVAAADGETLGHLDIRADNLLIDTDGQVHFVDWPWACACAPWVDTTAFLINATLDGHDPEPYLQRSSLTRDADPQHITGFLAALTGTWAEAARQPPPPGLPTIREFQRAQHDVTLEWVQRRTGWE